MTNKSFCARTRLFAISSLLSALSFAFSASALAGSDVSSYWTGYCYQDSGSTMLCNGTMAGIRNQTADPGRSAVFGYTSAGTAYFYMALNNMEYTCSAPWSMNDAIKAAMASPGYFLIQYNINTGVCTYLSVASGSSLKGASSL
jgi:hypothetical protein